MAGVQRGGRGEVECEREARSLGARSLPSAQRSRFALAFNFPPPSPLYAGHAGYFQNCPMFPCSHTLSECFHTVIFRNFVPCSQKLANVPLFPSIFCQCSLVPQNPWETLGNRRRLHAGYLKTYRITLESTWVVVGTQRASNVGPAQMDKFFLPAARQFPAQNWS